MKQSKDIFIGMVLLAIVAWCGAFAGEGAEPEKKTPDTYFVSPHVDPTMEFDVQEVEIKGVKLMIPVLKGCTLESSVTGEGRYEACFIDVLENATPIMFLFISTDNIHKDDGSLYEAFRAIIYNKFLDGLLSKYNAEVLESFGVTHDKSNESVFESNYTNTFLFRTDLFLHAEHNSKRAVDNNNVVTVSNIATYLNGYFITIGGLDFGIDKGNTVLMATWVDWFVRLNK